MHAVAKQTIRILLLAVPWALAGCLSFTSDNARPPQNTTVVVPPAGGAATTTVVCANGAQPPCN